MGSGGAGWRDSKMGGVILEFEGARLAALAGGGYSIVIPHWQRHSLLSRNAFHSSRRRRLRGAQKLPGEVPIIVGMEP